MIRASLRFILSLCIAIILAPNLSSAQEIDLGKIENKKSIDIRSDKNADNLYMIIFFARKENSEKNSKFGHAYMATLIFESNTFQPTGVFGLYPKDDKNWALGKFSGGTDLKNLDSEPDAALLVWVNRDAYDAVLEERDKFEKEGTWALLIKDCVSMMHAVAKSTGLKIPKRAPADYPHDYLTKLMKEN